MYIRIHFVGAGARERHAWVLDTERETVRRWLQDHPEAEDPRIEPLGEPAGLEAFYWQKCLYHDVFFERTSCPEVRAQGMSELMEILDLASQLSARRATELWNRCMAFRFGSDPMARRPLLLPAAAAAPVGLGAVSRGLTFAYARSAANESRVAGARVVSVR